MLPAGSSRPSRLDVLGQIIQSLVNHVPLLIFPGPIIKWRFNARKIQAAGAGLMGEANEFTPEWIHAALAEQTTCVE